MAIRSSCCLNLPPTPNSSSPSFPPKTSQLPWKKSDEGLRIFRSVAGVIIGLEMVCLMSHNEINQSTIAEEFGAPPPPLMETEYSNYVRFAKWSDRRMCPPWRVNSLESIVPENLPRPSARRRWEAVGDFAAAGDEPPAKVSVVRRGADCFSM